MEPSYYVRQGNDQYGPYPESQFKKLVASGTIKADAKVSTSELGPWVALDKIDSLPFNAMAVEAPRTYVSKESQEYRGAGGIQTHQSYPVYQAAPSAGPKNITGIVGFVLSVCSVFSCGFLSPIGFVVSLVGVFFQPRIFAVLGLVFSCVSAIILAGFIFLFSSLENTVQQARAAARKDIIHQRIHEFYRANLRVPTEQEYQDYIPVLLSTGFRYYSGTGSMIRLVHCGPDEKFDTDDDKLYRIDAAMAPQRSSSSN